MEERVLEMIEITVDEQKELLNKFHKENIYTVCINGEKIRNLEDYMNTIKEDFRFPNDIFNDLSNFDAYLDWMKDLSWLDSYNGYALFFTHFSEMMNEDLNTKQIISKCFEYITYFWEDEVEKVVVGGKKKSFTVFIIK